MTIVDMENLGSCPALGKECLKCGKRNHFIAKCKSKKVKAADLEDEEASEMYQTDVAAVKLDDSQLITLNLESGNFVRFQPDTGAQCNVMPLHTYKKASKDETLEKVTHTEASLVGYGGSKVKVVGCVSIRVWRNERSFLLDFRLVDNADLRPILGIKSCLAMGIIQYKDNDFIRRPETGSASVFAVDALYSPVTKEELMSKFPRPWPT